MYSPDDTIVALATPPGRGGLGVVRLSGPQALAIGHELTAGTSRLEPRHATLVRIGPPPAETAGGPGAAWDEGIATYFPAGHSYTGEDVVEFSLHGSPVVQAAVIEACVRAGARIARPGEFTLRAFLNGRLDLTRAEAVHDLVDATTPAQARAAFDQLSGTLAERIGEIERGLFDLVARLEASGDFPEEGYHFITPEEARSEIAGAVGRIDALLAGASRGRLLREGVSVAIVGVPNVGKSTLFNRLAGAERAIVTAVPGTTRDVLTESVMLLGTRMLLADTAGIRVSADPIEREGVTRAEKAGVAADVVVVVVDATTRLADDDTRVLEATADRPRVIALNKCDLLGGAEGRDGARSAFAAFLSARGTSPRSGSTDPRAQGRRPKGVAVESGGGAAGRAGRTGLPGPAGGASVACVSARTGEGIDALVRSIAEVVGLGHTPEYVAVSNKRHIDLLSDARAALVRALGEGEELGQRPEEVVLSDIGLALDSLQEVSGKRTNDDLLDAIFSTFCIGK